MLQQLSKHPGNLAVLQGLAATSHHQIIHSSSWFGSQCASSSRHASSSSSSTEAAAAAASSSSSREAANRSTTSTPAAAAATTAAAAAAAAGRSRSSSSKPINTTSGGATPPAAPSLDAREAAKFAALADRWWDAAGGPFAPLHALTPARCAFLRHGLCSLRGLDPGSAEPLAGLRVLDVGCGGGLLAEPVARMGAAVLGIDVSDEGVAAATLHAAGDPLLASRIRYQRTTLEELMANNSNSSSSSSDSNDRSSSSSSSDSSSSSTTPPSSSSSSGASASDGPGGFDVVMASEVIEHVRRPAAFVASLAAAVRPGGHVLITTLNRTPASYALGVLGAEQLLRVVPAGTHSWSRFITPQELAMMGADAGLRLELLAGLVLQPATGGFALGEDVSINYATLLSKQQG